MGTDATIYGLSNKLEWQNDFTATRTNVDVWQASESFKCNKKDIATLIPPNKSACTLDGWKWLLVEGVEVTNDSGDIFSCKVSYKGCGVPLTLDSSGGDGVAPDDGRSATYSLTISTSEEPIETHHKFKDISEKDLKIIQAYKNGELKAVENSPNDYTPKSDDFKANKKTLSDDPAANKLMEFIKKNIFSYLRPRQTWTYSYSSRHMPGAAGFNSIGKISSPIGPVPAIDSDRNWLYMGCRVSYTGTVFEISHDWELSGKGGWDTYLYQ